MSEKDSLKIKILETIQTWKLWQKDEAIAVAVSGGVDSIVLLHLMIHLPKSVRPKVSIFHFDHALRGKQSKDEADFVEKKCRDWKVDFYREKAPVWKRKSNVHEQARHLRYDFFFRKSLELGVKKLATAHQANDQAETFLMHWIQGSGLKGLSGIPISRDYVYQQKHFTLLRPLILATREEILSYAQKEKLKFCKDPSNTDQKYLRTRLRRLVGQLEKENLNFIERTAKNALLLQADESFLNEKVEELFYEGVDIVGGQWQCPFVFFQEVPRSLQYRLLQKIIHEISGEALSFDRIVAMLRFLETKDSEKAFSLSGLSLRKEKTHFYFSK